MAFAVEFCEGCPFAGKCSNDNEAWVGTMLVGRPPNATPEGMAVSWQDVGDETGKTSTPEVRMMTPPLDPEEGYTEDEFTYACYLAADRVDNCRGPVRKRILGVIGYWVCGAFGTVGHET